jgi:hypothetical protein
MYKWSTLHADALAKEIREIFPVAWGEHDRLEIPMSLAMRDKANLQRATLSTLAINLAKRFKEDNELFDPVKFLNACSPDVELYPLAELWEEDE